MRRDIPTPFFGNHDSLSKKGVRMPFLDSDSKKALQHLFMRLSVRPTV